MNKSDFLDILRDYLKGHFSEYEINDIIRDYEEFFLNGELEGKTEEEVILSLGSPKVIATDLIMEMKGEESKKSNDSSWKTDAKSMGKKVKGSCKKGFNKCRNFLNSRDIIDGNFPGWIIKGLIILFTIIMIMPAFGILCGMIGAGIGLIAASIADIAAFVFAFSIISTEGYMAAFSIFSAIGGLGVLIALWTIYINVIRFLNYISVSYISWVKTRFMYIRVKGRRDEEVRNKEGKANE